MLLQVPHDALIIVVQTTVLMSTVILPQMRNPLKSINTIPCLGSHFFCLRTKVWSTYIGEPLDAASILSIAWYSAKMAFPSRMSHQTLKSDFLNWSHVVSTSRRSLVVTHKLPLLWTGGIQGDPMFETYHQMALQGIIPNPVLTQVLHFPLCLHFCLGSHAMRHAIGSLDSLPSAFYLHLQKTAVLSLNLNNLSYCLRNYPAFQLPIAICIFWQVKYMFYAYIQG